MQNSRPVQSRLLLVLALANLAAGIFLWFTFCSSVSLVGKWSDVIFPPLVALAAIISIGLIRHARAAHWRLYLLLMVPSLVAGISYILLNLLLFVPPFTLGAMFHWSELQDETRIQSVRSPDGALIADVYFRGVGAYSGGNGRLDVRVRRSQFPWLENEVFHLSKSYATKKTADYVTWKDSSTLHISETDEDVSADDVWLGPPGIVSLVLAMLGW